MPPKKTTTATGAVDTFSWTPENDFKLIALMLHTPKIGAEEHAQWATLLGVSTTGGVRNRIQRLKRKFEQALAELGIEDKLGDISGAGVMLTSTPKKAGVSENQGKGKGKGGAKKRVAEVDEDEAEEELGGGKRIKVEEEMGGEDENEI